VIVLALNTAFSALDGAVLRDGEIVCEKTTPLPRGHEQHLPGFAEALLAEAGIRFGDVTRFGIVTGPGSFTGVRVGVAYMRGLALVTGAPCIGVTALEAAVPDDMQGLVLACLAAKKRPPDRSWWVQAIEHGEGIAQVEELSEAETTARLAEFSGRLVIDGADAFAHLGLRSEPFAVRARIAAIKAARFDPARHPPSPVYAREADATLPAPRA
jgi:tRNA threonylcarbamoyladenosine biosynthesis protein TsaB